MDVEQLEREADRAAGGRDFGRAIALLEALIAQAPGVFGPHLKLSALQRASGNGSEALRTLDRALAIRPLDAMALLMRATQLQALGRIDEAGLAYGRGLAQLGSEEPTALAPMLPVARARYRAWQDRQAEDLRQAVIRTTDEAPTSKVERLITNSVRLTEADRSGPTHYCFPGLGDQAFHDRAAFRWIDRLEAAWEEIAAELAVLLATRTAESSPYVQYPEATPLAQWAELNNNPAWTALHLLRLGERVGANASHCPTTMALLADLPQPVIRGAGPNAMFSLLAPRTNIPPHTGITNTRLVCHLPLIVPPDCWFRVGMERRNWREGAAWVFDDTVEHEAVNGSDQLRIVFIFDVWHPALSDLERAQVSALISEGGIIHAL